MNGSLRAEPCGIYKYMKKYSVQINYRLSNICPFSLLISDDIEVKFKIPDSRILFFFVHKSAYFNDKKLYEGGSILIKNIRGIIFHRKICRENDVHIIKELDEPLIFREHDIEILPFNNGAACRMLHHNGNFLKSLELGEIDNNKIFEEITVSLIYNRSLLEDLEKNII